MLVIAGESSGDEHAARVVAGLKKANPQLVVAALGGRALHAADAVMLDDLTAHAAVGIWEVLKRLPQFLKLLDETVSWIEAHKPRVVMCVDFVGFNLELAKRLYEKKISEKAGGPVKLLFYISPQIWAWKGHRRFAMAERLTSLGCIFPFEVEFYKDTILPVHFVGHPFVEDGFINPISYDAAAPILLLPGSRQAIVASHLPILWRAAQRYQKAHPAQKFVAYYASEKLRQQMSRITHGQLPLCPAQAPIKASAALSTAGTISLLTALAGIPTAVVYKTDPLTYAFGRSVYKLPYLAMPNLLLKRPLQREFIQTDATAEKLCQELERMTADTATAAYAEAGRGELVNLLRQPSDHSAVAWVSAALK